MSKPVFEDMFKFSGRRNRQSYILLTFALVAIQMVLGIVAAAAVASTGATASGPALVLAFICMATIVVLGVAEWAGASQRVRDFGQSGVWSLVMLVPYVGFAFSLALMLVPSSEGENKYGPSCI